MSASSYRSTSRPALSSWRRVRALFLASPLVAAAGGGGRPRLLAGDAHGIAQGSGM